MLDELAVVLVLLPLGVDPIFGEEKK